MRRVTLTFPLHHSFFGLGLNYKPILHEEIFTLIYHSHGGFNWSDVYTMPVWLRKYYMKQLVDTKEAEKKAREGKATTTAPKIEKPQYHRK